MRLATIGGSISGIVTDEGTGLPIADVRACAMDSQGFHDRCANTDANGAYRLNGLRSGTYSVEYEGGNRVNYLREFYEGAEDWAAATDVPVTVPGTTPEIDAKLAPGAQIFGHVSEIGSGAPREDVMVCAEEPDPFGYQACDWTDAAGDYGIRSIPAGTYLVAFELEYMPFGHIAGQWWEGAETAAAATPITIKPPESRSGINGQLPARFRQPDPDPIQVASTSISKPPAKKCRKGFHRKKGKGRCVKKPKKHLRAHKKGGRRSASAR